MRVIENYNSVYSGDLVVCNSCGTEMLVRFAEDVCPHCKAKGVLTWINNKLFEVGSDADIKEALGEPFEYKHMPEWWSDSFKESVCSEIRI